MPIDTETIPSHSILAEDALHKDDDESDNAVVHSAPKELEPSEDMPSDESLYVPTLATQNIDPELRMIVAALSGAKRVSRRVRLKYVMCLRDLGADGISRIRRWTLSAICLCGAGR